MKTPKTAKPEKTTFKPRLSVINRYQEQDQPGISVQRLDENLQEEQERNEEVVECFKEL